MSNYTRGIADAMLESRASGAENAAAFAAADAAHARRMLHDSEMSADRQAEEWRNYANKLLDTVYERTAEVSAAMVVIDSVIKEMESVLPPGQREQLRQAVARRARDRLEELDREHAKSDPRRRNLVATFAKEKANKDLRIV